MRRGLGRAPCCGCLHDRFEHEIFERVRVAPSDIGREVPTAGHLCEDRWDQ